MKANIKLSGTDKLNSNLLARLKQTKNAEVEVGYTANYAIYVHEMVDATFQRPGAQAKFLEAPLRKLKNELVEIVKQAVKNGATLQQGLFMAGLRLQRESQRICPIDTGNLRASAYTRKTK